MGIKGLSKIIEQAASKTTLQSYQRKTVGIDASIYLYRLIYRAETASEGLRAIVKGFLDQISAFEKHGITPLYIFDGYATPHKRVLEDRRKRRENNNEKIEQYQKQIVKKHATIRSLSTLSLSGSSGEEEESGNSEDTKDPSTIEATPETSATTAEATPETTDTPSTDQQLIDEPVCMIFESDEEADNSDSDRIRSLTVEISQLQSTIQTLEKQNRRPSSKHLKILMKILDILGIPYIHSPSESDLVCSYLSKTSVIDAVFSDDTDMLPFRCDVMVSGFRPGKNVFMTEYRIQTVLNHLELTYDEFVDVCVLAGCDYAEKVNQVAIKRAYTFIKEYGSIENVLKYIDSKEHLAEKHTYPIDFEDQIGIARSIFNFTHPHTKDIENMELDVLCLDKIETYKKTKALIGESREALEQILEEYDIDGIDKTLDKLFNTFSPAKAKRDKSQQSITSFFGVAQSQTKK
jgi:flap endonuclease-1